MAICWENSCSAYDMFSWYKYLIFPRRILEWKIVGQLTESVSPGFLFIRMLIMIYLFVLDDSLTS